MRKIAFLVFACCFSFVVHAQVWQDVNGGITLNDSIIRVELGIFAMTNDTIHHYLYVGGGFDSAGHKPAKNLARWNGENWSSVGNFMNDTAVFAMCMYKNNLVIGCLNGQVVFFDSAGTVLHYFGADDIINTLTTYNGDLYAGGDFTYLDTAYANGIARYNGTNWEPVGGGMQSCCGGFVAALYVWNNKLYAGGSFSKAGNTLANNIASWNDTTWVPLGSGTNSQGGIVNDGYVDAISSYNSNLYVTGTFDSAGGIFSKYIAKWDGINWHGMKYLPNNPIYCLMPFRNYLYMCGSFDSAGSIKATGIVKWNDTVFSSVNGGVSHGYPWAIDTFNQELYFAGIFDSAGNIPVNNIVRLVPDTATDVNQFSAKKNQVVVYPNPTSNQLTINCKQPVNNMQIEDVLGQTVIERNFVSGSQKQIVDVSTLPDGIYFYRITDKNSQLITGKFVKE